jgi:hypothetical protein
VAVGRPRVAIRATSKGGQGDGDDAQPAFEEGPKVQRWLLRHRRFHLHFTPTYGSWLNLVERWFSALTTKKLQRSAHRSAKALAADIRAWIEQWNSDPTPFMWHKSAEDILDRLAGYCRAVNHGA